MIVRDELEEILKEAIVAQSQLLPRHVGGGIEVIQKRSWQWRLTSDLFFFFFSPPLFLRVASKSCTHWTPTFAEVT